MSHNDREISTYLLGIYGIQISVFYHRKGLIVHVGKGKIL